MAQYETKPDTYRVAERHGFKIDEGREEIIFGEPVEWDREKLTSSLLHCDDGDNWERDGLTLTELKELLDEGYVAESQSHNASPNIGEFIEHGEALVEMGLDPDEVRFIAYVVSPWRDDCRIDVCGIYTTERVTGARAYFDRNFGTDAYDPDTSTALSGQADERDKRGVLSAWWD